MMTQSHFLITAFVGHRLQRRGVRVHMRALVLGSFVPDVPLTILTLVYFARRRWEAGLPLGEQLFGASYDALYFGDPVWITLTSLFHAPLLIALMALVAARTARPWLSWFAVGCAFHTAFDILTHHNDGPLLLYPFDWTYRYQSPISYWQPGYGGATVSLITNLIDVTIVLYFAALLVAWLIRRTHNRDLQSRN